MTTKRTMADADAESIEFKTENAKLEHIVGSLIRTYNNSRRLLAAFDAYSQLLLERVKLAEKVATQPAAIKESVSKWIRVQGDYVIVSRCNWLYPNAVDGDAGQLDERRYAAIGGRDGDIALCLNGAWRDGDDLAKMLELSMNAVADPIGAQPNKPGDRSTPLVDDLVARWDDDNETRGSAYMELRDLARDLERVARGAVAQGNNHA